jgi:2-oxoglutarate dehydrogenase E1 component
VTFACKLAIEYRQKFKRDIVIDMWCYRRFGHNEGDEPSFTQPLMYAEIRRHPAISDIYGARLVREGVVDQEWIDSNIAQFTALLEGEFEAAKTYLPTRRTGSKGVGPASAGQTPRRPSAATHRLRSTSRR